MRNPEKVMARIKKIHWWYATKHNRKWHYHEMVSGICERLPSHILKEIVKESSESYFSDLKVAAAEQMFLRNLIGEVCNDENREEIDEYYRKTKRGCRLSVGARRRILVES